MDASLDDFMARPELHMADCGYACAKAGLDIQPTGTPVRDTLMLGGVVAGGLLLPASPWAARLIAMYEVAVLPQTVADGGVAGFRGPAATANMSGALRDAARAKGNTGIGAATRADAELMGQAWVGSGHTVSSDGKAWISADKLRQYRPPTAKPNSQHATTGTQANFERRFSPKGEWQGNAHLDILD